MDLIEINWNWTEIKKDINHYFGFNLHLGVYLSIIGGAKKFKQPIFFRFRTKTGEFVFKIIFKDKFSSFCSKSKKKNHGKNI